MRSLIALLAVVLTPTMVMGQNMIQNPGFENGAVPTNQDQVSFATGWSRNCGRSWNSMNSNGLVGSPDLFDSRSPNCDYQIPANKWGVRNERSGGYRYVGFSGTYNDHGPQWYGETVEGTLTGALIACDYQVSFWASAVDGVRYTCNGVLTQKQPQPNDNKIEVVLRQGNNCNQGKVVYTSSSVTPKTWTQYTGQFTLSATDAAAGYNRIEFRLVQASVGGSYFHIVYLDDVSLTPQNQPSLNPDFQLTATMPVGNATTYQLSATSPALPAGASFWWQVEEIDLITGNTVPNTTMTNPSVWWPFPITTSFQTYYCPANQTCPSVPGVFQQGHKYRITRGMWAPCRPWAQISKTVFMRTN